MSEFELPDVELIVCPAKAAGLGARCGTLIRLTGVEPAPELRLTIRCELGHEASGTLMELFSPMDLAKPAAWFLEAGEFAELRLLADSYLMFVAMAAANGRQLNTAHHDQVFRRWAAKHPVVPFVVWLVLREHWDAIDKPAHPDRTAGWVPSHFNPSDWA